MDCSPDLEGVDPLNEDFEYKPLESINKTRSAGMCAICATVGDEWEKRW